PRLPPGSGKSWMHTHCLFWICVLFASAEFPQPCPKVCLCKEEARFVNCSGVSLSGSLIFPLETEHLDLSNSGLHAMPSLALRSLWKLQVLLLCGNDIAEVERGAFQSLERLQKLDISGNMITVLGSSFSAGLSSLLELSLSHNRIQANNQLLSLHDGVFSMLFKTFLTLQTAGTHILLSDNPWFCDCDLQRVFSKLHSVRRLVLDRYENITCTEPAVLRNIPLASVDTQLCAAEMATVLIITITALVIVCTLHRITLGPTEQERLESVALQIQLPRRAQDGFFKGKSSISPNLMSPHLL
uniref:LRRCT domain-containing protein n=1 Tax=Nothoprocta perdicaria TaxID=30464 RepID=A0A8C6ZM50_NOTPE